MNSTFGQSAGYFNQKNALTVNVKGSLPVIYFHYSSRENNVSYGSNRFVYDGSLSLGYTRFLWKNVGIGIDYSYGKTAFLSNLYGSFFKFLSDGSYAGGRFNYSNTKIGLTYMSFMPKIEFATNINKFPLGFINHLAIGFSTTKMHAENKFLEAPDYIDFNEQELIYFESEKLFNRSMTVPCITVRYGMTISSPINKHLILNYGLTYTLNVFMPFTLKFKDHNGSLYNENYDDFYVSDRTMFDQIKERRSRSIFAANVGITYIF